MLLALVALIYWPGLRGDFIFDDYSNIVSNETALMEDFSLSSIRDALSSGVASSIGRPLSMLSFGMNYYFSGLDPFYFKFVNLLIHLVISLGIYLLSRELLCAGPWSFTESRSRLLALAIAACWALHPLNVSSVLYIVQRMNQLAAMIVVFTLLYYCRLRRRELPKASSALAPFALILLLLLAGIGFKENAVLLAPLILVVEFFLLRFRADSPGQTALLRLTVAGLVVIPCLLAAAFLIVSPESLLGSYETRPFTMFERLLTQSRALWTYISWILMPDTREFTFYHDTFAVSENLLQPVSTLFACAGILLLMLFCLLFRKRSPALSFGIAFFLAGHAMESTVISLELVFEHRNYLPSFGLLFGSLVTLMDNHVLSRRTAAALLSVYLVFLAHGTFLETRKWSNSLDHMQEIVRLEPNSHRINYSLGYIYLYHARTREEPELLEPAHAFFEVAARTNPLAIRGHVGVIVADGIRSLVPPPDIVDELERRLRENALQINEVKEVFYLTDCWYSGICKFDKSILIRVFNAIAQNGRSEETFLQGVLLQIANAILQIYHQPQDSLALYYLAQGLNDTLTRIDLQIIEMELDLGNLVNARRHLETARKKQALNASLTERLQELESNVQTASE